MKPDDIVRDVLTRDYGVPKRTPALPRSIKPTYDAKMIARSTRFVTESVQPSPEDESQPLNRITRLEGIVCSAIRRSETGSQGHIRVLEQFSLDENGYVASSLVVVAEHHVVFACEIDLAQHVRNCTPELMVRYGLSKELSFSETPYRDFFEWLGDLLATVGGWS